MDYREHLDIPSAKERFMGKEELYKKFLFRFPDDTQMSDLEKHLAEQDIEQAFRDAHTMKGMVGNLSMNKLFDASSRVTEALRAGEMPGEADMNMLRNEYQATVETVREIMEQNTVLF